MRRVIDDTHFGEIADRISAILKDLPADEVSEYSWGTHRAQVHMVSQYILDRLENVKFGKNEHAHGIGNNNAIELIYTGDPKEEQICGYLHLVDDMFGGVTCWVTDYENNRQHYPLRSISGCDKSSNFDMERKRFSGWEDSYDWGREYCLRQNDGSGKLNSEMFSKHCDIELYDYYDAYDKEIIFDITPDYRWDYILFERLAQETAIKAKLGLSPEQTFADYVARETASGEEVPWINCGLRIDRNKNAHFRIETNDMAFSDSVVLTEEEKGFIFPAVEKALGKTIDQLIEEKLGAEPEKEKKKPLERD